MDPGPIGVVAGRGVGGPGLEGAVVGVGRRGRGGFSGEREEEKDRSEAEEREKGEERDFFCVLLLSAGHCLTVVVHLHIITSFLVVFSDPTPNRWLFFFVFFFFFLHCKLAY